MRKMDKKQVSGYNDLTIENLARFGIIGPPEMIWSLGIQKVLKNCNQLQKADLIDFERQRRYCNIQSEWTKRFFTCISPLMWPEWLKMIFIDKKINIYLKPFGILGEWLEFPGVRRFYKSVPVSELAQFWEIKTKVPTLLQFRIESNTVLIVNLLIERLCEMGIPEFRNECIWFERMEPASEGDPSSRFLSCKSKSPIWRGSRSKFNEKSSLQQFYIINRRMENLCRFIQTLCLK